MAEYQVEENRQKIYEWDFDQFGLFKATVWNGTITDLRFCRNGSSLTSNCLWTSANNSEDFLRAVHQALGELLADLDKK